MDDRSRDDIENEEFDRVSLSSGFSDEAIYHALSDSEAMDGAELLRAVKARVRRSIDDPRPSLSLDQIDVFLDGLVAERKRDGERA